MWHQPGALINIRTSLQGSPAGLLWTPVGPLPVKRCGRGEGGAEVMDSAGVLAGAGWPTLGGSAWMEKK